MIDDIRSEIALKMMVAALRQIESERENSPTLTARPVTDREIMRKAFELADAFIAERRSMAGEPEPIEARLRSYVERIRTRADNLRAKGFFDSTADAIQAIASELECDFDLEVGRPKTVVCEVCGRKRDAQFLTCGNVDCRYGKAKTR